MPRMSIGPFLATAATAAEYVHVFHTSKPIRMRKVEAYVTETIAAGTGVTMRVGTSASGQEVVASVLMTATTIDTRQTFTIANQVIDANKDVVWKVTATDRGSGRYCISFEWDDDV